MPACNWPITDSRLICPLVITNIQQSLVRQFKFILILPIILILPFIHIFLPIILILFIYVYYFHLLISSLLYPTWTYVIFYLSLSCHFLDWLIWSLSTNISIASISVQYGSDPVLLLKMDPGMMIDQVYLNVLVTYLTFYLFLYKISTWVLMYSSGLSKIFFCSSRRLLS